jgi:hypothetical protein
MIEDKTSVNIELIPYRVVTIGCIVDHIANL